MLKPDPVQAAPLTVAVRALCEFAAKHGDLDLRFTPGPTAQEGITGHAEVAGRRSTGYQREVSLSGFYLGRPGSPLRVRGRADGWDPMRKRLEEVKTHRGDLSRQPDNHRQLHWAQARVYASLLCQQEALQDIDVALVYYDINTQKESHFVEHHDATALLNFFDRLCERFVGWAQQEARHREQRDLMLSSLRFPHEQFREGQRLLAEAVYKANSNGRHLMIQAPTGIGKTMGTVFPVLKAFPGQKIDKLFYLTAKTPGRQLALDALQRLCTPAAQGFSESEQTSDDPELRGPTLLQLEGPALRVLELVARDKACEHPDKACHGDSCPLAKGFYDRLPEARADMALQTRMDKATLRERALAHEVCPYYLGQEMVRWSDIVIGDYNHYFDLSAMLYGMTLGEDWRVSLLVDEGHNLIDRARQMYTCELDQDDVRQFVHSAPTGLKKAFQAVQRQWNALVKTQEEAYQVHEVLPEKLFFSLQKLAAAIGDYFAEHPTYIDLHLQTMYFDLLHFLKMDELHGDHSMFDVTLLEAGPGRRSPGKTARGRQSRLCLRNVIPAPMLKERWLSAHAATVFSATLSPPEFVRNMLGLPENTVFVDVPSPFAASQLQVHLARHISTRYADRQSSLPALVDQMASQYRERPGNYLAFFSSFDYLQSAAALFKASHPDITVWLQERGMAESQREHFIAGFEEGGQGIGFAVLGGAFGEGIDLPGSRLIGAFIATLGLPQINPVNEQFRQRLQKSLGQGYDYTYLFPGLQKVVQAAGRVIRTPLDQGVIVLMDDRFGRAEVRRLLPSWWPVQQTRR